LHLNFLTQQISGREEDSARIYEAFFVVGQLEDVMEKAGFGWLEPRTATAFDAKDEEILPEMVLDMESGIIFLARFLNQKFCLYC
jgi:hypothetical protein